MNNKQTVVKKQSSLVHTNDHFSGKSSKDSPAENSFSQNVHVCKSKMIETDKALKLVMRLAIIKVLQTMILLRKKEGWKL